MLRKNNHLLIFLFLLFFCAVIHSQDYQFLESILDEIDEENEDNLEWIEFLWELLENPFDLNEVSENELNSIPFITSEISKKIIGYRRKNKGFKNVEELSQISNLSEELCEALRPFVTVRSKTLHKSFINRSRIRYEIPSRRGYLDNIYSNRLYSQNRFLFNINNSFYGGFLLEKDAGEQSITDYLSYYFKYKNNHRGLSLLVGDYYLKIGFGLILSSAYGVPISPYFRTPSSLSNDPTFENKSSNEFNFLKGISLFKEIKDNFSFSLFCSHRSLDAGLSKDKTSVNNFSTSGLHRSENEKRKKGIWDTELFGILVNKSYLRFNTQMAFVHTDQGLPFRDFDQKQYHLSFSYDGEIGTVRSAAEIAFFQHKYPAIQHTLKFTYADTKYDIVSYYYHPQYFALFGKSFASLSDIPQNELGIAFLLYHPVTKNTRIGAYAQFYREAHNREEVPFFHRNYFLEMSQKLQNHQINLQFKQRYRKNTNANFSKEEKRFQRLRLSFHLNLNRRFILQNRIELSWAKPLKELNRYYGILVYLQLNWQFNRKWKFLTRWTTFDVPDYDVRLYEYEPDLPGTFRTVLLNNRGYKILILFKWIPLESIQFDLKYQQRFYPDLHGVGSGWDAFDTNRIHEIKLSIIMRYD